MAHIQFDYSTLSTSISRSELGSIIGNHIVDSNYDIDEETNSEKSSDTSEIYVQPPPPDKCKFVLLTFGLLGIGTLLPWNFFITANDYWMYKFRSTANKTCIDRHNKTDLQAAFTSYLAISNNVPYVIFLLICTLYNNRFSKLFQVLASLVTLFILFSIVTAFVEVNTDAWENGFFAITLLIIVADAVTSAILQSGVASVVSLLPSQYMHIMVLGQALAGIIASIAQTLSLIGHCDSIKSALIYFFSADAVILITLIAYGGVQNSEFYKYHIHFLKDATSLKNVSEVEIKAPVPLPHVLKLLWPYAVSVFLDLSVTIGIFPGLAVLAEHESQVTTLWEGKLYLPLVCFLLFNVSDFCGRAVGGWIPIPHSKRLFLLSLCVLRVVFFPLFLLSNLHPRYHFPVVFSSDAYYVTFMTFLGFTNGYCVATAMVVGIKSVSLNLQGIAGVILSTCLAAGLMLGSFISYICIQIL